MNTTNHITINLSLDLVSKLYNCHNLLPEWFPGFISLELISSGSSPVESVYLQKHATSEGIVEEEIRILSLDLPKEMRLLASSDHGERESLIQLQKIEEAKTKIIVSNNHTKTNGSQLDKSELRENTQAFLEAFKDFIEPWSSIPENIANHSCC